MHHLDKDFWEEKFSGWHRGTMRGDDIMVIPIDGATAGCLGRVRVGEEVTVQPTGAIKRKGRSR
jgi:hypothetical protein